ncbi:sigma 54-interacting transcriptional regulator [Dyadobacter sp. CY345]|uniref:sigma-54-dependent Fis family transcriptional regulator n=1 Tax=Dyadobacter sp. CY345 TaxID=2909335 RepID=UPI001F2D3BCF|nr:sigma 54-interacting transcriptional regulator [Dyadobacter sp. CY345]MCF2446664.1 sigma 54-interacting transcriptional regulator [Dyadobacter sp. CY345]
MNETQFSILTHKAMVTYLKRVDINSDLCSQKDFSDRNENAQLSSVIDRHLNSLQSLHAELSYVIKNRSPHEDEKSILLSLSSEIAAMRDKAGLFNVLCMKLRALFSMQEFAVVLISDEGETLYPYFMDVESHVVTTEDFPDFVYTNYPVDSLRDRITRSEDPFVINRKELFSQYPDLKYLTFCKENNIDDVIAVPLRFGNKKLGCLFFHQDTTNPDVIQSQLLKAFCAQISVAVSHVTATEEILRRDQDKSVLLNFSNDIASVRDKTGLALIIKKYLKNLFGIREYFISIKNDDNKTLSYFLHDIQGIEDNVHFQSIVNSRLPIANSLSEPVFQSDEPVVFDIDVLLKQGGLSTLSTAFWQTMGAKRIRGLRLKAGQQDVGILWTQADQMNDHLLKGISSQIAIAISNILANEEISRREAERELLLSINSDLASVRSNDDLLIVIKGKVKSLLGCSHTTLSIINEDKITASAFLLDPDSTARTHPDYEEISSARYVINDGIMNKTRINSRPVSFDLEVLDQCQKLPPYLRVNLESGLKEIVMARCTKEDDVFGFWLIHFKEKQEKNKFNLIESLANQISIAVCNIRANAEIQRREDEKSRLIAFSNAIASVRDKTTLAKIIKRQLFELFKIDDYVIHIPNEDRRTHNAILFDPESDYASQFPNPIINYNEGWGNWSDPDETIADGTIPASYISLRIGCEDIAVMHFRQSDVNQITIQQNLFKSICSQLAITVANVISNEKVSKQIAEISSYKQQLEEEKIYLKEEIEITQNYAEIIGESLAIQKTFRLIAQVAPSDSAVLLLGETGTGKELVARAIHNNSPRKNKMMVKVNCAALPANLIESELFGHERGSFTGATERRLGKFELANNGTLFLDEIGEMPLELQVKLLRALQEKEIERVGGKTTIKVDVRIIAATNRDLEKEMEEGRFRSDLFYRLNIFPIYLSSLRDRREDIPLLATHFIHRYSKKIGRKINTLTNRALQDLMEYSWPGNIRELEHLIERSILLSTGDTIKQIHLPVNKPKNYGAAHTEELKLKTIDENEREHILMTLKYCKGRVAGDFGAAEILGVHPSTLNSKIKRLGIKKEHFA